MRGSDSISENSDRRLTRVPNARREVVAQMEGHLRKKGKINVEQQVQENISQNNSRSEQRKRLTSELVEAEPADAALEHLRKASVNNTHS